MHPRRFIIATLLWATAGCALGPPPTAEGPQRADDLVTFARLVRDDLEAHRWQSLLAASDPTYYRQQVIERGVDEASYLAGLFGLLGEGNRIQEGDDLGWDDLERIAVVRLVPLPGEDPPYRLRGQATLLSGAELRLDAWATVVQGRFVLTGPPPTAASAGAGEAGALAKRAAHSRKRDGA